MLSRSIFIVHSVAGHLSRGSGQQGGCAVPIHFYRTLRCGTLSRDRPVATGQEFGMAYVGPCQGDSRRLLMRKVAAATAELLPGCTQQLSVQKSNTKLVISLPETDSLVTQLENWGPEWAPLPLPSINLVRKLTGQWDP